MRLEKDGFLGAVTFLFIFKNQYLRNEKSISTMIIRFAEEKDIEQINKLLVQVNSIHHRGRPDLFKSGKKKYTDEELRKIMSDCDTPVLVAADDKDRVLGYAFCIFQQHRDSHILTDIKTLYIDDLCVDEGQRGNGVGKVIYDAVQFLYDS